MLKKNLLVVVLLALIAFTAACGNGATKESEGSLTRVFSSGETVGEGQTSFLLTVVTADGRESSFTVKTNEKTVGEALVKSGFIGGEKGPYGLYVKTVNGISYDFDKDGKYWAFYINDEYSTSGVDKTPIEKDATYKLKAE